MPALVSGKHERLTVKTTFTTCASCGAQIEEGAKFCPVCGAPAPGMGNLDDGDAEIAGLLAAANLCRIRRHWEEAMEKCQEILQHAADNVSAHVLLGDIYQNQNRLEDAALWYRMALDLDPNDTAVSTKLQRVENLLHARQATSALGAGASPSGPSASGRTRVDQFVRGEGYWTLVKIVTLVLSGLFLIVVSAAIVSVVGNRRSAPLRDARDLHSPIETPNGQQMTRTVPAVPSASQPSGPAVQPSISQGGAPGAAITSGSGITPPEAGFLDRVRSYPSVAQAKINVESAFADPRTEGITVLFQFPQAAGAAGRKAILTQAKTLAEAAYAVEPEAKLVTVRANANISNSAGGSSPQIAFMGDISAQAASQKVDTNTSAQALEQLFTQVFWHPFLRGG